MREKVRGLILAFIMAMAFIPVPTFAAPSDIIDFPDPNFEAAVRDWIDKPAGEITKGDVENINEFYISYCDIVDLTGIEYFTALKVLDCEGNELTALDVSNNTALQYLKCDYNQLTKLDVSNNTALIEFSCWGNELTALNISNNTALQYLDCEENYLATLDVSKNTYLLELHCNYNYLPSKSAIVGLDENRTLVDYDPQNVFAPNVNTASNWAHNHINGAYNKGFLLEELQSNYKNAITRGEFVRLSMSWLRYYTGMSDDELLAEHGVSRGKFSDTTDPVVLAAAALGITAGVGNGKFGVNDQFEREQAAVMLTHVVVILGEDTANPPSAGFIDIGSASTWARDQINYVGTTNIMDGVGGNKFDPKTTFSREQSIIVFNKLVG